MQTVESEKWRISVRDTDNEHHLHNAHVNPNDFNWDDYDSAEELEEYVADVCRVHRSKVTVKRL